MKQLVQPKIDAAEGTEMVGTANTFAENKGGIAMLGAIGESAVRMTVRTDSNIAVDNNHIALQKIEKVVEKRSVDSSGESSGSRRNSEEDSEKKNGNYKIDDQGIYFEKYDKEGKVIFRTPPEKYPIDEHV